MPVCITGASNSKATAGLRHKNTKANKDPHEKNIIIKNKYLILDRSTFNVDFYTQDFIDR